MYQVYYADESFLEGAAFETKYPEGYVDSKTGSNSDPYPEEYKEGPFVYLGAEQVQQDVMHSGKYEKLSNEDCMREYAKNLVQDRGNVILVIERPKNCSDFLRDPDAFSPADPINVCVDPSTTSLYAGYDYRVSFKAEFYSIPNWYNWICSQDSSYYPDTGLPPSLCSDGYWRDMLEKAEEWEVYGHQVQYCMSERLPSQCRLQVATNLIGVVIGFNIFKLIIIVLITVSDLINQKPLVTIGDATASFIERPDERTEGMCLRSAMEILASDDTQIVPAKEYQPHKHRWAAAVSIRRWWAASLM